MCLWVSVFVCEWSASHGFAVTSFLYRCRSGAQAFTGHMQAPGRKVAFALAVARLRSALVGRWSAPVPEPHCVRERKSDFERLVGQNLWRLESLVKHVGDFASSGQVDIVPFGEEPTRVFPGAVFRDSFAYRRGVILTAVKEFTNGCRRRARTRWRGC